MSFNKSRFALELLSFHTAIDMQDSGISEEFEGNFLRIVEFYSEYINDWAHERGFTTTNVKWELQLHLCTQN